MKWGFRPEVTRPSSKACFRSIIGIGNPVQPDLTLDPPNDSTLSHTISNWTPLSTSTPQVQPSVVVADHEGREGGVQALASPTARAASELRRKGEEFRSHQASQGQVGGITPFIRNVNFVNRRARWQRNLNTQGVVNASSLFPPLFVAASSAGVDLTRAGSTFRSVKEMSGANEPPAGSLGVLEPPITGGRPPLPVGSAVGQAPTGGSEVQAERHRAEGEGPQFKNMPVAGSSAQIRQRESQGSSQEDDIPGGDEAADGSEDDGDLYDEYAPDIRKRLNRLRKSGDLPRLWDVAPRDLIAQMTQDEKRRIDEIMCDLALQIDLKHEQIKYAVRQVEVRTLAQTAENLQGVGGAGLMGTIPSPGALRQVSLGSRENRVQFRGSAAEPSGPGKDAGLSGTRSGNEATAQTGTEGTGPRPPPPERQTGPGEEPPRPPPKDSKKGQPLPGAQRVGSSPGVAVNHGGPALNVTVPMTGTQYGGTPPIAIRYIHQREIKAFSGLYDENIRNFLEKNEKFTNGWDDQASKGTLGQYLEEDALNWIMGLESEAKRNIVIDSNGWQSTEWREMLWEDLRSKLEKAFGGKRMRSIYGCVQNPNERAMSYYYDMVSRLGQSETVMLEKDRVNLIKTGLQPGVSKYLRDKRIKSLSDLEFFIKAFDKARREDLVEQNRQAAPRKKKEMEVDINLVRATVEEEPPPTGVVDQIVEKVTQSFSKMLLDSGLLGNGASRYTGKPKGGAPRWNAKIQGAKPPGECFRCKQAGHWRRDCPLNNSEGAGASVDRPTESGNAPGQ